MAQGPSKALRLPGGPEEPENVLYRNGQTESLTLTVVEESAGAVGSHEALAPTESKSGIDFSRQMLSPTALSPITRTSQKYFASLTSESIKRLFSGILPSGKYGPSV